MRIQFIALFLFITYISQAQESEKYLKLKAKPHYLNGYVILKNDTRIQGVLKVKGYNPPYLYNQVKFVNKEGVKNTYYPSQLKEYGYNSYKFISIGSYFYRVDEEGDRALLLAKVVVSTSYGAPGAGGVPSTYSTSSLEHYVKKTDSSALLTVKKRKFIEKFTEFFNDCEEVVNKIYSEEVDHRGIKKLVELYNNCE